MTTLGAGPEHDVPERADGISLIGEMAGSGYRVPPSLVRRGDGQTLQLTPLLYATLAAVDGRRSLAEIADEVAGATGKPVSEDNVRTLLDEQLLPLGLLTRSDGSQPEVKRSDPLLGLKFRYSVTEPERTRRLTDPFTWLFRPFVVLPMMAAFVAVCWWVFLEKGLASATYEAFENPGLLILVFAVTILSAGFHEFGHAAAARYGGSTPGVMGAGLYLVWPAFYTDVTDSYRLGRGGRVRTDLGGLYFNAIVAVGITGLWWVSGYDALLLVVATQILQMIRQLTPLVRFDGYHVLADLTGVPDLFHRIKPTLLGALPWRWGDPEARVLKPWARVVVTTWVLLVVPLLLFALTMMVLALPRILATAWASLGRQQDTLGAAWADGDLIQTIAQVLTILAIALPILGIGYILLRVTRQVTVGTWRATAERPLRRALAGLTALALLGGLAWAWWPDGTTYRPIQPTERGTLTDGLVAAGVPGVVARPAPRQAFAVGQQGSTRAVWDTTDPMPTRAEPQLAVVMVPPDAGDAGAVDDTGAGQGDPAAGGWVFPFDKPLEPEPGDNQALAVTTEDGAVEYDVAVALVWVEDGEDALNTNEAYAYASCESCAAVAVAFQVVLVVGDNDVAVPQNLAGSVNYNCVNCLTYSLAQQLFITLDGPLSDEAMAGLDRLWADIAAFGASIRDIPLDQVAGQLDDYEAQILAIIEADQPGTVPSPGASGSGSPSPSAEPGSPSPSPSPSGSPSPSPSVTPTTSPSPTPTPSATPSASPTPSPTPTPTPSSTPTP